MRDDSSRALSALQWPPAAVTDLDTPAVPRSRTWQLWRDAQGEFLVWGRYRRSWDDLTLVREFQSENWLTAEWEAFRRRPPIDRNMRELVTLLNELPGVMTTGCCQGHPRRGDSYAYVGLHVEDVEALDLLVELLGQVVGVEVPLQVDLQLNWGRSMWHGQETLPAGALAFFMKLSCETRRERERVPRRGELAALARSLRLHAHTAGLLRDPTKSAAAATVLRALRTFLVGKRRPK